MQTEFLYKFQATRPEMISKGPTPEEEQVINDHYHYLKGLTGNGVIRLFGRTQNEDASSFGIVIFQTDSEKSACTIMQNDPATIAGVMRAELYPFRTVLTGKFSEELTS